MVDYLQYYFAIRIRQPEEPLYPFSILDLLEESTRLPLIEQQSAQLGHPDHIVVGTLFAKRYAVFSTGIILAMSQYDYPLEGFVEHVRFRITNKAAMQYQTELIASALLPVLNLEERRIKVMDNRIRLQGHLQLIFQAVSQQTGVSLKVMWSLVSHHLQQGYARLTADSSLWQTEKRLMLIMADRDTLLEKRSDNLFVCKLSEFQHPEWQGQPFYLRRHCCMAYKLSIEDHGYCQTCPKLSVEDRLLLLSK